MFNVTEVDCGWGRSWDGTKCVRWIDMGPGWVFEWKWSGIISAISFFSLVVVYLNRLLGIEFRYRATPSDRVPIWRDFISISTMVGAIGYLLMGVIWLDGWGFLGTWSLSSYLGVYPLAYGLIPAHVIMMKLHWLDRILLAQLRDGLHISRRYSVFVVVLVGLLFIFAAIGFPAFGWRLRTVFMNDPNSTLGEKGNNLVLTMYVGIMCACVFAMLPVSIELYKRSAHSTRNSNIIKSAGLLNTWNFFNFVIAAANIAQMFGRMHHSTKPDDGILGLIDTLLTLDWNRIFEVAFGINHMYACGYNYEEQIPFIGNFISLLTGEYGTQEVTSRTKTTTDYSKSVGLQSIRSSKGEEV